MNVLSYMNLNLMFMVEDKKVQILNTRATGSLMYHQLSQLAHLIARFSRGLSTQRKSNKRVTMMTCEESRSLS